MEFDTSIHLDYEDQCLIAVDLIQSEIRYFLSDEATEDDDYRYEIADRLLDAHGFFADEDEHFDFVTSVGGAFVTLRKKVLG